MSGVNKFDQKFKTLKLNELNRNEALKNKLDEKNSSVQNADNMGKTTTNKVDAKVLLDKVAEEASGLVVNNKIDGQEKELVNSPDVKYADNVHYDNRNIDIWEFLSYMTEGKGLNESEFKELIISFIKEVLMNEKFGRATISAVTELIDIMLSKIPNQQGLDLLQLIQQDLMQYLLSSDANVTDANVNFGEVKDIVNRMIDEIIAGRPPVEPDPVEPDPVEPEPDPVEPDNGPKTAEEARDMLYQAINAEQKKNYPSGVVKKENIADFLAQFKDLAVKYVQLSNPDKNYSTEFCEMLVMFMIQTIEQKYNNSTVAVCSSLRDNMIEKLSDLSFLDTSNDRFMGTVQRGTDAIEVWITRIEPARTGDGFQLYGTKWMNNDNDFIYNKDGSINQGIFFTFMTNYLRDAIFGGQLNESELKVLYEKILKKFAGSNYNNGQVALNPNGNNTTNYVNNKYDNDNNGSWFDDFYRAMMEVAAEVNVINLDEVKDEDINLDTLFGGESSISTSDIHNNANTYLLSNEPAVRLIFGELINASDKYNITTDADNLDLMNVFVQMINKEAGVADTLDNKGNQILTREALTKYLEKHSIQELKDFIQGTGLRDAYFESTFKINGEIEGFHQADSGDCWFLSGVMSLNSSPEGKEIIKNAIKYDPETGKYSVTFYGGVEGNGIFKSWCQEVNTIEFTKEELFDLMATGLYSKIQKSPDGTLDWDLFLLEVATKILREEQGVTTYLNFAEYFGTDGDPYLYMGSQDELISYLTGIDLGIVWGGDRSKDTTYYGVSKKYRQGLHQLVNELINQCLIDSDGTIHNYAFYFSTSGHAYAITRVTGDKVYFIDPYDSSKEYYTTWSSFESGSITYYDAKTGKKAGTLSIQEAGYVGPLDECPALNQN